VKAFLAATAEGYRFAAAHPEEAADLFVEAASAEPGLGEPLDAAMCRESMQLLSKVCSCLFVSTGCLRYRHQYLQRAASALPAACNRGVPVTCCYAAFTAFRVM
jgi:hypothetical protein